jgi:hypothetical protein
MHSHASKHSSPARTVPPGEKPSLLRGHFPAPGTIPSPVQLPASQPYAAPRVVPTASIDPRERRGQPSTCPQTGCRPRRSCSSLALQPHPQTVRISPERARNRVLVLNGQLVLGHKAICFGSVHLLESWQSRVNPHNHSDAITSKHSSPGRTAPPWGKTSPPERSFLSLQNPPFTISVDCTAALYGSPRCTNGIDRPRGA